MEDMVSFARLSVVRELPTNAKTVLPLLLLVVVLEVAEEEGLDMRRSISIHDSANVLVPVKPWELGILKGTIKK